MNYCLAAHNSHIHFTTYVMFHFQQRTPYNGPYANYHLNPRPNVNMLIIPVYSNISSLMDVFFQLFFNSLNRFQFKWLQSCIYHMSLRDFIFFALLALLLSFSYEFLFHSISIEFNKLCVFKKIHIFVPLGGQHFLRPSQFRGYKIRN